MTDENHQPDLSPSSRAGQTDLAALAAHPSLASLRGRGWLLDRLSVGGTAWAFAGALVTSFVAYGTAGAVIVSTWTGLTLLVAGLTLITHDVARARVTLTVTRYGLLTLLVGVIAPVGTVGPLPSPNGDTRAAGGATAAAAHPQHAKDYANHFSIVAP